MRMMTRLLATALALLLCAAPLAARAASPAQSRPPLILASEGDAPVLTFRRQANLIEQGTRSGTLMELYADKSLLIYALYATEDGDASVLLYTGGITDEAYRTVARTLRDGGFFELPEWIETFVLDGDTVKLTASTEQGAHTVGAYSPDGTPFGEIVRAIEELLGAYKQHTGQ